MKTIKTGLCFVKSSFNTVILRKDNYTFILRDLLCSCPRKWYIVRAGDVREIKNNLLKEGLSLDLVTSTTVARDMNNQSYCIINLKEGLITSQNVPEEIIKLAKSINYADQHKLVKMVNGSTTLTFM